MTFLTVHELLKSVLVEENRGLLYSKINHVLSATALGPALKAKRALIIELSSIIQDIPV